jgi:hypothetical protein
MTLDELITDLKAAGANENTLRLAMNCYELGKAEALIQDQVNVGMSVTQGGQRIEPMSIYKEQEVKHA